MLTNAIVRIIDFCIRHAWSVILVGVLLALASGAYTVRHFAINSDINTLLSPNLDWRKRELALEQAFRRYEMIVVVVQAPTPELTGEATTALAQALEKNKDRFRGVTLAGGGDFFARNGLMFQAPDELKSNMASMVKAEPLIRDLNTDLSLRGLVAGIEDALLGLKSGAKLDDFARTFNMGSDTLEKVIAGEPASFSWRVLAKGKPAAPNELRGIIEVRPVLDFSAIEAGHAASQAIRATAAEIAPKYQATVRLTGPVAMEDEELSTIKEGALLNGLVTVVIVLIILWLALRSERLIVAVFINLFIGLALTAALGLMMVGALNLISVYFAVLFVGIGVDFGIQYSVRYRAERHELGDLRAAILVAGKHVGAPLTLAAGATAAGFLSFLPTDYRGVSELGLIAGFGMLIAFATSITILPALIRLLNPPGEPHELGFSALAPVDEFLERRRIPIIVGTVIVVVAGLPLLYWLRFDFNPINLRSPTSESIATYLELSKDPEANTDAIQVMSPSLKEATAVAARLEKLPEVARVISVTSFVPDRQSDKLPVIRNAARALSGAFDPKNLQDPPTDDENVEALNEGADRLIEAAGDQTGAGALASKRLAGLLTKLAKGDKALRDRVTKAFVPALKTTLDGLHLSLQPQPVSFETLPADLVRQWVAPDGKARIEISPKGDPRDNEAMRQFARAALAVAPGAIEGPISILEAGDTITRAFIEAGLWALLSISVLLWIVLRRIGDVLLTIIPLAVAGVVTLEVCVLIGMPLNFANIIALPLLLGVGVAFKIYYIMAWREGQTNLLQTALTRAVFFSALTTATAFGSLWFSGHPGTASMGKLLALSLMSTLAAAVLFQPLLMGKPRNEELATDGKPRAPKPADSKLGDGNPRLAKPLITKPVLAAPRTAKPRVAKPRPARPRKITPDTRA
jgi:hopanoid biosynthesis associated RND transporter like protein HpnN